MAYQMLAQLLSADSPRCQRSHNSVFSAALKSRLIALTDHHTLHLFRLEDKVLRRSVETTGEQRISPKWPAISPLDPKMG